MTAQIGGVRGPDLGTSAERWVGGLVPAPGVRRTAWMLFQ